METGAERDLTVDVLVIGAGIPALYIARALHPRYSVCVVSQPGVPDETYESGGRFSAGYDGNDLSRIAPARRAAGWWRLWAESTGVPHDPGPAVTVLQPEEAASRTRLWADAGLAFARLEGDALPAALAGGPAARRPVYAIGDDVIMDPARVAAQLRSGLEDRILSATVMRAGTITPEAVDFVALELGDGTVMSVTPRFVVLAADAANAGLLHKIGVAFKDRTARRDAVDTARGSQAVRRRTTIVVRGDLPLLATTVDGMDITAHPAGGGTVWLAQLPVDDSTTVVGADDHRFMPPVDRKVLADGLGRLLATFPSLSGRSADLRWSAYVARQTVNPVVAQGDGAGIPLPVPARLETLGMDALVAVWPSHLAYAMVAGDVVAERVRERLGAPAQPGGPPPATFGRPAPGTRRNRWESPELAGEPWDVFAGDLG